MNPEKSVSPAESKPSPEENQFSAVTNEVLGVLHRHPDYYGAEQITDILDKLNKAKISFERGEIPINEGIKVNLFGGLQSRDESMPHEREANRVVEDLYISLNSNRLAGYHPANYFDIEKDALDLASKHLVINKELDTNVMYLRSAQVGGRAALAEDGEHEPTGIKIKISDNILASFDLGNFGAPEETGKMTFVDLFVIAEQ